METDEPFGEPSPPAPPEQRGPYRMGAWRFTPLGDDACKVALTLNYEFSSFLLGKLVGELAPREDVVIATKAGTYHAGAGRIENPDGFVRQAAVAEVADRHIDGGAQGIVVPHVDTAEEAARGRAPAFGDRPQHQHALVPGVQDLHFVEPGRFRNHRRLAGSRCGVDKFGMT